MNTDIPAEKVREALLRSPSGYLSNEETLTAYKDLRRSLSVLLAEPRAPVEEPTEWGSVVRAFVCGSDSELWVRTLAGEYSGWTNATSKRVNWSKLCEPEVLRVGVGPDPLAEWENDLLNMEARRDTAAAVLGAIDVDQYLIDAVVNARPR